MSVSIDRELAQKLSSRGILAYVAVLLAGEVQATTAALAGLVKAQSAAVAEGLKELADVSPETVRSAGRGKWRCGTGTELQVIGTTSRYGEFVEDLKKYWDTLNPTVPFDMGGADGAAIRQLLRDHPSWDRATWRKALNNRGHSVRRHNQAPATQAFYAWVRRLGDYLDSPLNAYNKPEGNDVSKAAVTEQRNRQAVQQYLNGHI